MADRSVPLNSFVNTAPADAQLITTKKLKNIRHTTKYRMIFQKPITVAVADKIVDDFRLKFIEQAGKTNYVMTVSILNDFHWMRQRGFQPINKPYAIMTMKEVYEEKDYESYSEAIYQIVIYIRALPKGGCKPGKEDTKDCLWICLASAFSPGALPGDLNSPIQMKKFLGIPRNDGIEPFPHIARIDSLLRSKGLKINVSGDFEYVSPNTECGLYANIHYSQKHYQVIKHDDNRFSKGVFYSPMPDNKVAVYKAIDKNQIRITYADGTTKIVDTEEYKLTYRMNLMLLSDGRDPMEQIKEWISDAKLIKTATNGIIDMMKYTSFYDAALHVWRFTTSKKYSVSGNVEILPLENTFLEGAFMGGLRYFEEYTGPGYKYDVNSFYPHLISQHDVEFPIAQPTFEIISTETIAKWRTFQYGIYHATIDPTDVNPKLFKLNKYNYYTHWDLNCAKEHGYKITMIDDFCPNVMKYPRECRARGDHLFGSYNDLMDKVRGSGATCAKKLRNFLWGSLAKTTQKSFVLNEDTEFEVKPGYHIIDIYPHDVEGSLKTGILVGNAHQYFQHYEGRMAPFITSRGRLLLSRTMAPLQKEIVQVNTDGFISKIPQSTSFYVGLEPGLYKLEKKGNCTVEGVIKYKFD